MAKKLKPAPNYKPLEPSELTWTCDPEIFEFESTKNLEPVEGIIGQERALKALRLGVDLYAPGYNIFVTGLSGTGKATTIKKILERISPNCPTLYDYAYVNNFSEPDMPRLLVFPAGVAQSFANEMNSMIDFLIEKIPVVLEDEAYAVRRKNIMDSYAEEEKKLMLEFENEIKKDNFSLGQVQMGQFYRPEIFPIINGKPVPIQQLAELVNANVISPEDAEKVFEKYQEYTIQLQELFKKGLQLSREYQEKLTKLEQEAVNNLVTGVISDIKERFNYPKVHEYLDEVKESILNNLDDFKAAGRSDQQSQVPQQVPPTLAEIRDPFRVYQVNVILDNSATKECPVIIETTPTYSNIFGSIERVYEGGGAWYSDFMNIKAGSILRANGGYLVLNAFDALTEPGVWKALKRVLMFRKLEIHDYIGQYLLYTTNIKPEPIEINTKIIFIGSDEIYYILSEYEEDFKKIFKVRADFDYEMKNTPKALNDLAGLVRKLCEEENLLHFDRKAIAKLAEFSARYAGSKNKLTARFAVVADIVREANFWAKDSGAEIVTGDHVKIAYDNYVYRHNMLEEKINERIKDGTLIIDISGEKVGEINGLAVYSINDYTFGKPSKITATVSAGSSGIISIEREARLSGKIYDKGVLVITGLLKEKFGQDFPLSFTASICFEQSYGGIDGDSASSTEVYALISALSGIPIKQGIAVTGSVNQKGVIQPIGGVNEKIEGFFKVCKLSGLDGNQGVIIPKRNLKDLMLDEEVVEAVKNNKFKIWAIDTIDEGVEILTGYKAGKYENGKWERGTVYEKVYERLKELYEISRNNGVKKKSKSSKQVGFVVKKKK
ncbi:MAG: AAA family ATPase [Ignavibacteria bacterium]|nr:AAA family ATPase [Ignavibacteria bacterium]